MVPCCAVFKGFGSAGDQDCGFKFKRYTVVYQAKQFVVGVAAASVSPNHCHTFLFYLCF